MADNDIEYQDGLKDRVNKVFVHYLEPLQFLVYAKQISFPVLNAMDKSQVDAETRTKGNILGASMLLDRLARYPGWFQFTLDVLRHPDLMLGHVADQMEAIKKKYDEEMLPSAGMSASASRGYHSPRRGNSQGEDLSELLWTSMSQKPSPNYPDQTLPKTVADDKDYPLYCDVCKKRFTGQPSAKDHFQSKPCIEKHKVKNVYKTLEKLENGRKIEKEPGIVCYACDICYKLLDTFDIFETHKKNTHQQQIISSTSTPSRSLTRNREANVQVNQATIPESRNSSEQYNNANKLGQAVAIPDTQQQSSPAVSSPRKSTSEEGESSLRCKVCNKTFTGQAPLEEHEKSKDHKKKIQILSYEKLERFDQGHKARKDDGREVFICDVCIIELDSLKAFENHKSSKGHTDKLEEYLLQNDQLESDGENMSLSSEKCELCKTKTFSGQQSADAHYKSRDHLKRHRIKFEYNTLQILVDGRKVEVENGVFKFACDVCLVLCDNYEAFEKHKETSGHQEKRQSNAMEASSELTSSLMTEKEMGRSNLNPSSGQITALQSIADNEQRQVVPLVADSQLNQIDVVSQAVKRAISEEAHALTPQTTSAVIQVNVNVNIENMTVDQSQRTNVEHVENLAMQDINVSNTGVQDGVGDDDDSDDDSDS